MKVKLNQKVVSPKGLEYTIVGIEDNKVILQRTNKAGEEVIKEFKKSTVTKTFKPAPQEDDKETKEAPRKEDKTKLEGVISLKDILESLGIEPTAEYTKKLRKKLRKNEELKALRIEGYNWSFKLESKEDVVKKLKDIV